MSLNDKIIKLLKEKPASSKELHSQLKQQEGYDCSLRTLQRQLDNLREEGVVQAQAIRRGIIYSLGNTKTNVAQDYFISKAWAELFELQKQWNTYRLETFTMLFPETFRKTVTPALEIAKSIRPGRTENQMRSAYNEVCGKIADFLRAAEKKRIKP